jgi:PKD repeat protein
VGSNSQCALKNYFPLYQKNSKICHNLLLKNSKIMKRKSLGLILLLTTGCVFLVIANASVWATDHFIEVKFDPPTPPCDDLTVMAHAWGYGFICPGWSHPIGVSADTFQNYQWYLNGLLISGANAATYQATQSGEYRLVASDSNGCSGTSNVVIISQNIPPIAEYTFSMDGKCVSFNVSQPLPLSQYRWDFGDPNAMMFNQSQLYNPVHCFTDSGAFQVRLIIDNPCGSDTSIQTLYVCQAAPVTITSAHANICPGQTTLLTATTGFGVYQWKLNAVPISETTDSSLLINAPGSYKVLVIDSSGCSVTSNTVTIAQSPLPEPKFQYAASSLSVDFSNNSLYSNAWRWDFGDGTITTETSPTHIFPSPGIYSVTLTAINSCDSITITQSVELDCITPLVVLSGWPAPFFSTLDTPITLSGTPTGGQFSGTGVINQQFDPAVAGIGNHLIYYTFTDILGCTGVDSAILTVSPAVSAIALEAAEYLTVFPNPNQGTFSLKLHANDSKIYNLRLINSVSNTLLSKVIEVPAGTSVFKMSDIYLIPGIYQLVVEDTSGHHLTYQFLVIN